jgi:MFS family permease
MALVFGVTYALSCLTKLSPSFWILMVGRFAGGIATSLLFTVFESWMVHEHHRRGFDQNSLNSTFGTSVLLNSLAAICAGLVASISSAFFGFVSPFMLSFLLLVALVVVVQVNWTENYGNADLEVTQNLQKAVKAIRSNFGILLLGIVQSLFEGSMYVFVFMWTPTLAQGEPEFHQHNTYIHGIIFSTFMIAVMLGSTIFGKISEKTSHTRILSILLIVAGVSLLAPVVTTNVTVLLVSFIIFEACCGLYFPIIASLRSSVIPEDSRSTIMSLFRMGLNLLVIVALKFTASLSPSISFILCCLWLFGAALMMVFCFPSIQPRESIPTHIVH